MNHIFEVRTTYILSAGNFVVEFIQKSVDFLSVYNTQDKGNDSNYGNNAHTDIMLLEIKCADQKASGHTEQSSHHRKRHKCLEVHIGNPGCVAYHIFGKARYQIQQKDDYIGLFTVEPFYKIIGSRFSEEKMYGIFAENFCKIKRYRSSQKSADNGKHKSGKKAVQIAGCKLKCLSRYDTDDDLQNLDSYINKYTLKSVVFQIGKNIFKRSELLDKIPLIEYDIKRNCNNNTDQKAEVSKQIKPLSVFFAFFMFCLTSSSI